jgi:outer membrane protein assembly factor BamB
MLGTESGLSGFFQRRWCYRLQAGQAVLAAPNTELDALVLIGSNAGELFALAGRTGQLAWRASIPFAPAWAGTRGDLVLVAGPAGVTCQRRDDGSLVWYFAAPPSERLAHSPPKTFRPILDPDHAEELEGFQLSGEILSFMQGRRRLLALDVQTGRLLWARWAPSAQLRLAAPAGTFVGDIYADAERLLAQTAAGRYWLLDPASGRLIREGPCSRQAWQHPPLKLSNGLLCLVEDTQHIVAIDAADGRQAWSHALFGKSILTGLSPQLIAHGNFLLIVTPTNLGCRAERVDIVTGQSLWECPLLPAPAHLDTTDWAIDGESFYRVYAQTSPSDGQPSALLLECRSIQDGTVRWQQPLEAGPVWTVRRVGEGLVCFPSGRPEVQFSFRWAFGTLQWVRDRPSPDSLAPGLRGEWPMVWCDPHTGATVQRIHLESRPRLRWSHSGWGSFRMSLSQSPFLPGSFAEASPAVRLGPRQVVVALARDVWSLMTD